VSTSEPVSSPVISSARRTPLRINLVEPRAAGSLAGVWWPQSRDIDVEVADLVDNFPGGRVSRVLFSRPDWDTHPRSVQLGGRRVKTGSFPSDDTHLIILKMADHSVLRLLLVPPGHPRGESLMRDDLDDRDHHDARDILSMDVPSPEPDSADHWDDDGGSWWHPDPTPPSYRTRT
jgi:uncharacterized protein DUF5994